MSETLHAALVRLAAACASDDARAIAAPWIWTDEIFLWNEDLDHGVLNHGGTHWPVMPDNREVIAASRNRLPELARVLADAAKRIDLLENLAIQDGAARDQLRNQIVAAERERDQAIVDHRDALDQWEAEVNVAIADETKGLRDQLAEMRAAAATAAESVDRVALWETIHAYVVACGGDPSEHVYGNTARMDAVARVESLVSKCTIDGDALRAEVLRLTEESARLRADGVEFRGCPCRHVTPCRDSCSCASLFQSGGCDRCCSYGSSEQRQAKAESMVAEATDRALLRAEIDQLQAKLAKMTAARDGLVALIRDIETDVGAEHIEPWQRTRLLELKIVGKEKAP
jgi:hypothetical protein